MGKGKTKKLYNDKRIKGVVIYGHQGCGKTLLSPIFLDYYGKSRIIEAGSVIDGAIVHTEDGRKVNVPIPNDALVLTASQPIGTSYLHFTSAIMEIQAFLRGTAFLRRPFEPQFIERF